MACFIFQFSDFSSYRNRRSCDRIHERKKKVVSSAAGETEIDVESYQLMARTAGLDTAAFSFMNIADVLDYIAEYVNEHESANEEQNKPRQATQADIDTFRGRTGT